MLKLDLIKRNVAFLSSSLGFKKKLFYYPGAISALLLNYNKTESSKKVRYLGHPYLYDNPSTPLSLMYYPKTVSNIFENMDNTPKTILDIGGNIGQFSYTLSVMLNNKIKIDVFEPNPNIFKLLEKNLSRFDNINSYNFAIAEKSVDTLYFTQSKSATGSFYKKNAGYRDKKVEQVNVKVTNDVKSITGKDYYDLVKIDVEGYEYDLIKYLNSNLSFKYMYIEVSNDNRARNYKHSELFSAIQKKLGEFDIVYSDKIDKSINSFNLLIKVNNV